MDQIVGTERVRGFGVRPADWKQERGGLVAGACADGPRGSTPGTGRDHMGVKMVNPVESKEVLCQKCNQRIGYVVEIDGVDYLLIGGGIAREWHGVCAHCGKEVHWSTRDRQLEKKVKK